MDEQQPNTLGNYLRAARRKRRLSIERAAEETRIRQDFLMRMESDEFDFLAPTYVRGFLKSYTRFLGLEVEPVMDEFDRRYGLGRPDAQIVAEMRGTRKRGGMPRPNGAAAAVIAVALVLSVFAFIGLVTAPEGDKNDNKQTSARSAVQKRKPSPSATIDPLPEPSFPEEAATGNVDPIALNDGIELEVVATAEDCWVRVKADGVTAFEGTIPLGESETITATSDMEVRLGFPQGVDLLINGEDIQYEGGVDPVTFSLPSDLSTLQ